MVAQASKSTASDTDLPLSREELFGAEPPAPEPEPKKSPPAAGEPPTSREELFGIESAPSGEAQPEGAKSKSPPVRLRGFVQAEPTYTYAAPDHWSRAVVRTQVEALGQLSDSLKWKASLRLDLDPVYANSDFYPAAVKEDQRAELLVRETYLDWSAGNWDLRLGRQNIVWGEVVGLFFADVVSARDLRDFILPEFEILRIPQWAARAEYFWKDSHLELVWIPYPSYDNIGEPGAEFYPLPAISVPGFNTAIADEQKPGTGLDEGNYGLRLSTLRNGWDLAGFYYRSQSANPTFYRDVTLAPTPTITFTPRHDRIWQAGGTLGKDFRSFVLKLEGIYTANRGYEVTRVDDPDGVVEQDTLEYIVGLDFTLPHEVRLNLQGFQRYYLDYDATILADEVESGLTLLLSGKITPKVEPSLLLIQSLNRNDGLGRLRVNWYWRPNWRLAAGLDVFHGPSTGYFGRYDDRDRIYLEARYSF